MDTTAASLRYRAFIAYSHRDQVWARWLHRALETYRVPRRLVGKMTESGLVPARLLPIFRDREELPSATDLSRKINDALEQSTSLIVICSPAAAASRWVNEEVRAFKRLGRADRIFCLIVAGEPNASHLEGHEAEECFPPALLSAAGMNTEPIAADVRHGMDGKFNAKLKLISGLLGVGFDTLRQREHQRRIRRLTAVAIASMAVMVVTVALGISAFVARNAAERRQKQAESLIDFMLGDLNDKLTKVQRLDLLEAVDDKAMAYFKSQPSGDSTGEAPMLHARALRKIGSVRLDQGHLQAAMESFQAASRIAAALAGAAPGDVPRQVQYAEILGFIGVTHWRQGKLDEAQKAFEAAQEVLQRVRPQVPGASDWQVLFQLATVHNNIGHVLEVRGDLDAAAQQYRQMLAVSQQLLAVNPNNEQGSVLIGTTHNNLGKLALMSGDLAAAIAEYRADDAIESALSQAQPSDNDQRENMLTVRAILGRTLALAGEVEIGMLDLEQAIAAATQLATLDAHNSNLQEDVGLYTGQLCRLRRLTGDLVRATALAGQSIAVFSSLTQQDPANTDWQREYAEARIEEAALARAAGNSADARVKTRKALDLLDTLVRAQPDDRATLLAAVTAKLLLASVTKDAPAQRSLREEAMQAVQAVKTGRGDPRLLALEVEALLTLDRRAQADPAIRQMWESGYRDPALVSLLSGAGVEYPVNTAFSRRLRAALQLGEPGSGTAH
jgi:eukaryotic-like serine/threonine-protein kinase